MIIPPDPILGLIKDSANTQREWMSQEGLDSATSDEIARSSVVLLSMIQSMRTNPLEYSDKEILTAVYCYGNAAFQIGRDAMRREIEDAKV